MTIENRNLFAGTDGYVFAARLLEDGHEIWHADYRFDVAAGDTQHHDIAFPDIDADGDTREVTYEVDLLLAEATAWAPAGYELAFGQLTGTLNPEQDITETSHDDDGRATRTLSRWNAGIRRDDEEILLSRTQGGIVSWKRDDREMVIRRPELVTFRPLTDNDRGNHSGFDRAAWFAAGRYAIVTETKIHESDDGLVAEYQYELADPNHTPVSVTYHVNSDMRMQLTVEYPGNATDMASLPAFGIEWELPGEYDRLRYYGPGPEETYRDRKQGGKLGIWDATAKASMAPYLMVQETGSHEDVRCSKPPTSKATDCASPNAATVTSRPACCPGTPTRSRPHAATRTCPNRATTTCACSRPRWASAETTPGEPPSTRPTSCPPAGRSPST